jgi:tartrate dehydratase beta subunit/fumarate hydratase class I family protein
VVNLFPIQAGVHSSVMVAAMGAMAVLALAAAQALEAVALEDMQGMEVMGEIKVQITEALLLLALVGEEGGQVEPRALLAEVAEV